MTELNIRDLKKSIDVIFNHIIDDMKVDKLPIKDNQDFYWEVPSNKLYEVKDAQPQLDIGRLGDDWQFLRSISKDREQAVALMLIHVAPLLRYVGEEIGK